MSELPVNAIVELTNGKQCRVKRELGRGGQGIVYLVNLNGEEKALKWYINPPDASFYENLQKNVIQGAPSDAFLWPEYLTERQKGSYGYVMKLRPQGYYEFGNYLLAKKSFKSYSALLAAAMKICNGFMLLHRFGYSYQDLNDGNFFINPNNGDILICDNDNVMPQGEKSGIMGKARYMAPEIVNRGAPDKYSDRFSLSVILFMLFYANHPFEGAKVVGCPCMTESYEKKFYGSEAVFIYDPTDKSNRPVQGIHHNVIKRWPAFPVVLRDTFIQEFSQEKLQNPQVRMIEQKWEKLINNLRDSLVVCPNCKEETFVASDGKCMNCCKSLGIIPYMKLADRQILLTSGTNLYIDNDNIPDCLVEVNPNDKTMLLIKNISPHAWTAETSSGKLKIVLPNECVPVKNGIKITFDKSYNCEIVTP
ncbi:protein kinase [Parabacteroides sp. OttesenSCG-928-J18]|nr:protein kinase [Parabacteroides sp. OttesenSCG-928-J18]